MSPCIPLILCLAPILREEPPRVAAVWPSGPVDLVVALRDPGPEEWARSLPGQAIELPSPANAPTRLAIAAARWDDDRRTLRLATDPHPSAGPYRLPLPAGPVEYDLHGVEARWWPPDADLDAPPARTIWLPSFQAQDASPLLQESAPHRDLAARLAGGGTLQLHALLLLPEGPMALRLAGPAGIEAELDFEPLDFEPGADDPSRSIAEREVESFGEPIELIVRLTSDRAIAVERFEVEAGPADRPPPPIARRSLLLPWAPPAPTQPEPAPPLPDSLLGGDPARGAELFFGDRAKCSSCHRVDGRGESIGPDLSRIAADYDAAALFRELENPSAAIRPEYLPFTLATSDGRVAAGIVRADGPDRLMVIGADGKPTSILRAEVSEIRATSTSIMPVGLTGVIGAEGVRDLLAYLLQRRGPAR